MTPADMDDAFIEHVAPQAIESPCILVCVLDTATGWCLGCGRTGAEIAGWTASTTQQRRETLAALPARMDRLAADMN